MTKAQRKRLMQPPCGPTQVPAIPPATPQAAPQAPLSRKAMLVSLAIQQWGNRALDRNITNAIAHQHGADRDLGRYTKTLIAKEALAPLGAIVAAARTHHYENTLPWTDEGFRILPSKNYMAYASAQHVFEAKFDAEADTLAADFDRHVRDAKRRLNGLFSASDYPKAPLLRRKFSMKVKFSPFPDGEDFRMTELDASEVERIRDEINESVRETMAQANRHVWQRIHEAVSHLRDRLDAYAVDKKGKIEHPFRDSVIGNLRDLAELLPRLNVEDDPALDAMQAQLAKTLCTSDPAQLRADPAVRAATIKSADDILAAMAGYVGDAK